MTECKRKQIETTDGVRHEIMHYDGDAGGELCRAQPEHPIASGEGWIDIIDRNNGEENGSPYRYCVKHGLEEVERLERAAEPKQRD